MQLWTEGGMWVSIYFLPLHKQSFSLKINDRKRSSGSQWRRDPFCWGHCFEWKGKKRQRMRPLRCLIRSNLLSFTSELSECFLCLQKHTVSSKQIIIFSRVLKRKQTNMQNTKENQKQNSITHLLLCVSCPFQNSWTKDTKWIQGKYSGWRSKNVIGSHAKMLIFFHWKLVKFKWLVVYFLLPFH